jgi:hypothetical protein
MWATKWRVKIMLKHPLLENKIWLPFINVVELTIDRLMDEIVKVLQSYEEFTLDANIVVNFMHIAMPMGRGNQDQLVNRRKRLTEMRKCVRIKNDDNCGR